LNQFPVNNRHKKSIDQESSLNFEGIALMENKKKPTQDCVGFFELPTF